MALTQEIQTFHPNGKLHEHYYGRVIDSDDEIVSPINMPVGKYMEYYDNEVIRTHAYYNYFSNLVGECKRFNRDGIEIRCGNMGKLITVYGYEHLEKSEYSKFYLRNK